MPSSPSNACSSPPLHSHPFTSYHLLICYISHPSLLLPPLMKTVLRLLYPSLSVSLSFSHLPFLYSLPVLSPVLFFSPSPFSVISHLFSSCRPPASLETCCLSSVFTHICRLFLWGGILCVLSTIVCYLAHQVG